MCISFLYEGQNTLETLENIPFCALLFLLLFPESYCRLIQRSSFFFTAAQYSIVWTYLSMFSFFSLGIQIVSTILQSQLMLYFYYFFFFFTINALMSNPVYMYFHIVRRVSSRQISRSRITDPQVSIYVVFLGLFTFPSTEIVQIFYSHQ